MKWRLCTVSMHDDQDDDTMSALAFVNFYSSKIFQF